IMDVVSALLLIFFFVFSYLYFVTKNNDEKTKLINEFPGPKIYPIIGTPLPILWMKKYEIFCYLRQLARQYGPVYKTWIGNIPAINITSPEYAELILNNSTHITKGYGYKFLAPWLGDGLLLSKGEKWHRHRKLLTPAFHFKILENFMDVFVDKSKFLVKRLANDANGKPFNIFPYITRCTLDIISETAMGIQVNAMNEEKSEYVSAIYGVCSAIVHRFARIWLQSDFIYNRTDRGKTYLKHLCVLHSTTNKVIQKRKEILHQTQDNKNDEQDVFGAKKRKAFLDVLLEVSNDSTGLTHEQIREEVDTFMFEGHDTTTASICWTIFLLGLHLDIQERAFEEVSQILCDDKSLEISDLNELKYLERIIKESLRLYPSVGAISRIASSDIKIGELNM
ncbi:cytochrome P450, partial [Oryctes borbonicus]